MDKHAFGAGDKTNTLARVALQTGSSRMTYGQSLLLQV
jgi:hypothetical protein